MKRRRTLIIATLVGAATSVAAAQHSATTVKEYVVPIGNEYEVDALFSVG